MYIQVDKYPSLLHKTLLVPVANPKQVLDLVTSTMQVAPMSIVNGADSRTGTFEVYGSQKKKDGLVRTNSS